MVNLNIGSDESTINISKSKNFPGLVVSDMISRHVDQYNYGPWLHFIKRDLRKVSSGILCST